MQVEKTYNRNKIIVKKETNIGVIYNVRYRRIQPLVHPTALGCK